MAVESVLGSRVRRVDSEDKITGLARFTADLQLPGVLHGRLLLSPYAHARITRIDPAPALEHPGVVAVITAEDLRDLLKADANSRARDLLADDRARFCGQPVAAVLAESEAAAEDALSLVEVEYEPLPAVLDPLEALEPDVPAVWEDGLPGESAEAGMHATIEAGGGESEDKPKSKNVASTVEHDGGDVERGFAEAEVVVEQTYRTSMVHQGYLEPHASIAALDPLGNLTIWTSTQALFYSRSEVAELLGQPEAKVRVVPMPVGGGFGGKVVLLEPLAAALAILVKRPVSLVYTRMDEFLSTTPAPQSVIELKLGAKRDGTLAALDARVIFDAGLYPGAPTAVAALLVGGYYPIPNFRIRGYEVVSNKTAQGAYRAPGAVQGTYAIESSMDELARQLNLDPIELRLKNCAEEGDKLPNGAPWPRIGLRACLERLRDHPLWQEHRRGGSPRAGDGRLEGVGVAAGGWLGGIQPASAVCRLEADGTLNVVVGSVDISGTNTGLAMMAAEALGVGREQVSIVNADSGTAPYSGMSGGSKITLTTGAAVVKAAEDARRQVLAIAADQLEASVEDLEIADGKVQVRGVPERSVTLAKLAQDSMAFGGKYEPIFGRGQTAINQRAPGFAAHLARVGVDPDTGKTEVMHYVAVQDVGKAVNPVGVEDQIMGGVVQGIGWALYEQMAYDASGQLMTASLLDYTLPGSHQAPLEIEPIIVEVPSQSGPYGVRGVGEPPVVPVAATVANALRDATGARLAELPMNAERVAAALRRDGHR
jgi:CO/xanthine dehydrogenase Mo-binding subunit